MIYIHNQLDIHKKHNFIVPVKAFNKIDNIPGEWKEFMIDNKIKYHPIDIKKQPYIKSTWMYSDSKEIINKTKLLELINIIDNLCG